MREHSLKDDPGASCWGGGVGVVMVVFICNQAGSCWLQDQVLLVPRNPAGREDSLPPERGLEHGLDLSRGWTAVQAGVNELEVIAALDIATVFKSRLKLIYAEESTVITHGSCIACLHGKGPSNPSRLWNVLLNEQRRGWRMLALLGSLTDMHKQLLSQRNLQPKTPHWGWWAVEAPPCLKTWKHPRL